MPKKKKKKKSKVFIVVLIIVGVYFLFALIEQHQEMQNLRMQKSNHLEEIQKVEQEIANIKNSIENAESNEQIEKKAREKLRMIHADEIIFIDIGKTEN
ncbi:MAG: FtsB family cell division protein [Alkaliphilus sp.]